MKAMTKQFSVITELIWEHERNIWLWQPKKSGLTEHCWIHGHWAVISSTSVFAKPEGFGHRVIFEIIAIRLEPQSVNRDSGFNLSVRWQPVLDLLSSGQL